MNKEIIFLSQPAEVSMADEWFEIASTQHFWMEWRFRVIHRLLEKTRVLSKGGRYLEIGCGHGQFLAQCEKHIGDISIDGCDLNLYALKKIEWAKGDIYVYNIFDLAAQMRRKYVGVFLLDVIEHIDDDATFLKKAIEHVDANGLVVINVPALAGLFSQYDVVAGHKRRYTRKHMRELFKKCNLEPIHIGYWGLSLLPIAFIRKIYLSFVSTDKVISKGFSPGYGWVNSFFKILARIEMALFHNPFLGTSVIAVGRVKSGPKDALE